MGFGLCRALTHSLRHDRRLGFARARLLPEPRAHRLRHLGATIGAHNGKDTRWVAKQQQASLLPPSERVFASPLGDQGLDRQGLDMQGLSALFETFFRANSIFLPDAGREE